MIKKGGHFKEMSYKNIEDKRKYMREYMRKKRKDNPTYGNNSKEYMREYQRKRRRENPDCEKEYYRKNKDKYLESNKKWRENNPKVYKKWYLLNKEQMKEYQKEYREKNKEYIKEYIKRWQLDNPKKMKIIGEKYAKTDKGKTAKQKKDIKRRAKENEIINTLIYKEWLGILKKYKYKCAYCGIKFTKDNPPTKDHIIPISKGGNNTKDNVVPACRSCNSKKWNKIIRPFQQALKT